ncbi:hypothetical protein V1634_16585 [Plantactinospora veratri]|uniref:Uncharacterized protein n=1 Tax=Plantactinospora veratri TaxID=1436122 RepID=A0ABU7SEU3_9ACTN
MNSLFTGAPPWSKQATYAMMSTPLAPQRATLQRRGPAFGCTAVTWRLPASVPATPTP